MYLERATHNVYKSMLLLFSQTM